MQAQILKTTAQSLCFSFLILHRSAAREAQSKTISSRAVSEEERPSEGKATATNVSLSLISERSLWSFLPKCFCVETCPFLDGIYWICVLERI